MKLEIFFLAAALTFPVFALAVDEHHKEAKELVPGVNESYQKSCGTCHFAYPPGLLPARSWLKIIDGPNAHPGGDFAMEARVKAEVKSFLVKNSAEKGHAKRAKKILASLGGETPVRISEIAYIKDKHRKVTPDVFARKTIGSRANCIACHKGAENGIFDDDDVVVPE